MLIASVGRHEQGMTFVIVQDHERTTPHNLFKASYQPAWNQVIGVNGFAMSIDVKNRHGSVSHACLRLPERSGPACQGLGECLICPNASQLCQKPLYMAIPVGEAAPRE
jgi:hypothetical protein